jgi:hypothetical protein
MSSEEISLELLDKKIYTALLFMAPSLADYKKVIQWVAETGFMYDVLPRSCNNAKLYDIDKTRKGIVKGNVVYIPKKSRKNPKRKP